MNILVLTEFFLPHAGGSRVYYYNLYKHLLAQSQDRITVLTRKVPGWEEFDRKETLARGLKIHRRSTPVADWKYTDLARRLPPLLAWSLQSIFADTPNVIQCGDLFPQGLLSVALKRLFGIPYIVFCHGEEITQTSRFRTEALLRNRVYREAAAIVVNSEFTRRELLRTAPHLPPIHKITPGVDADRFRPRTPHPDLVRRFDLEGKFVLLTVSRLFPHKGHRLVIDAMAELQRSVPNLHYLVVGSGPDADNLRAYAAQRGVGDRLTLAGEVADDELPDIYALCDVFVMPNGERNGTAEGFGIVFLEAGAAGKPVIGGLSGGTDDSIADGETGFRVDPNDPGQLVSTLLLLAGNEHVRNRMGARGKERARSEFDWASRGARLRALSLEVANAPALSRGARQCLPGRGLT